MSTVKIQDISDRVYQGQVYALLDRAKSSIVLSMYLIRPGEDPKHPVNRLLQDLIEARRRGVEVAIYLNTKFKNHDPAKVVQDAWFDRLREAGVVIHLISPVRRLHDKLVIVDRRFVVEGSMNWSVSAIAENLESATIIESPELAEAKLHRFQFFPLWGKEAPKAPRQKKARPAPPPLFPDGPPPAIEIPKAFLEEKKYIPAMISRQSERALRLLLLLLYLSQAKGARKFHFFPEAGAEFLGILSGEDRTTVRRQMVRLLREFEAFGGIVKSEFHHGKDTLVGLELPPGPAFTVGTEDLSAGELAVLEDNEIFLRLIRARLREEGKHLEDLPQSEIEERFHLDDRTLRRTLQGPERGPRQGRKPAKAQV